MEQWRRWTVVDLCRAVSLRYAVPVSGEIARLIWVARLVFADGGETFDTLKKDNPPPSHARTGRSYLARDDRGVTCRRAGTGVRGVRAD